MLLKISFALQQAGILIMMMMMMMMVVVMNMKMVE